MKRLLLISALVSSACLAGLLTACAPTNAVINLDATPVQTEAMTFFITSVGLGNGGDLGGLNGADQHCQKLAETAGSQDKTWKAYLSTSAENARDRIGNGPWQNARGIIIAENLEILHTDSKNNIEKGTALNEKGEWVTGRGDSPNLHDILTGSTPQGAVIKNQTCGDWTQNNEGVAMVGHHDRNGLGFGESTKSWNSAHASLGCDTSSLKTTGGAGLFYCFAKN